MKTFLEFHNVMDQETKEDLEMLMHLLRKDGLRVELEQPAILHPDEGHIGCHAMDEDWAIRVAQRRW